MMTRRRLRTAMPGLVVLFVLFHFFAFSLLLDSSSGVELIFDHNETWGNGTYNPVYKFNAVAQSFEASNNYTVTRISLHVISFKDEPLNVTLQTSDSGLPSGTVIGNFTPASSPPMGTSDWMNFLATNQTDVLGGETYWIVAMSDQSAPNGYRWYTSDEDAYPQGVYAVDDTGDGGNWVANSTDDQMFRVWGSPLIPTMYFDLTVDKALAEPGETIQYTVFFNNTGNVVSANVWINDSLPSGLDYVSDTASSLSSYSGGYMDGADLHYNFTNVPIGSHSFVLQVVVNESHPLDVDVTNWAYMDYTDALGYYVSRLGDGATSRIEFREPTITVAAAVSQEDVESQDVITFWIYYNNTGNGNANRVWINDTLPNNVEFLSSSTPPAWNQDREYRFVFSNVSPSDRSLSINVIIESGLPRDTTFVNTVTLNYTNARGQSRPGSYDSTISILVSGPDGGGDDWFDSPPILVSIVLVVGLSSAAAIYVGMNRKKLAIDEVFLLHRSGELIKHYTRRIKPEVDSDILSGMLVAVQEFITDSFRLKKEEMNRMEFGDRQIVIVKYNNIILAAVTSGPEPKRIESQLRAACEEIEETYGEKLKSWSGLVDELEGADEIIQTMIMDKY